MSRPRERVADDPALRPTRTVDAAAALASVLLLLAIAILGLSNPRLEPDTRGLVVGTDAILGCLARRELLHCRDVWFYPLFQYVPALVFRSAGLSRDGTLRGLAALNTVAFLACLALLAGVLRRTAGRWAALTAVVTMLTGPLLWYSGSTLNEVSAACVTVAYLASVLRRRSAPVVCLSFAAAAVTKEIALPFLVVLGMLAMLPGLFESSGRWRGPMLGIVAGAMLGAVLTTVFNQFRFGAIVNTFYLSPQFMVRSPWQRAASFAGIWVSPNAGLLAFWPSVCVGLAAALVPPSSSSRMRDRRIGVLPAVVLLAVLGALTFGFASFFNPFGWITWGPRLILPWMPGVLLLAIHFYPRRMWRLAHRAVGTPRRMFGTALALCLVSLPQIGILFLPSGTELGPVMHWYMWAPPDVGLVHYPWLNYHAWRASPLLVLALGGLGGPAAIAFLAIYCAGVSGLLHLLRRELRGGAPQAT